MNKNILQHSESTSRTWSCCSLKNQPEIIFILTTLSTIKLNRLIYMVKMAKRTTIFDGRKEERGLLLAQQWYTFGWTRDYSVSIRLKAAGEWWALWNKGWVSITCMHRLSSANLSGRNWDSQAWNIRWTDSSSYFSGFFCNPISATRIRREKYVHKCGMEMMRKKPSTRL